MEEKVGMARKVKSKNSKGYIFNLSGGFYFLLQSYRLLESAR
jgi:hypothetical protein